MNNLKIYIAPSILAADPDNLNQEIATVEKCADLLHYDNMDGYFVPRAALPLSTLKTIQTSLPIWAHLMVRSPEQKAIRFVEAGVKWLTFHVEATHEPSIFIRALRAEGVQAGVALKPSTSIGMIKEYLHLIDHVLVMTVEPGKGGQKMIPSTLEKIRELRYLAPDLNIAVDGGINAQTIRQAAKAGANVFVAGTAIFEKKPADRCKACEELRALAEKS